MLKPKEFEGGNPYEKGTIKVPNIANEDWVLLQIERLEHRILRRTIATVTTAAVTLISAGWAVFLIWFNQ